MSDEVRIDKWLWSVRLYKTRSLAIQAIKGGKVKHKGENVKPARTVKVDEVFQVSQNHINKIIKVKALLHNRISAKDVALYLEDLTPIEEKNSFKTLSEKPFFFRPRGIGRPTKRDRRKIDEITDDNNPLG